MVRHREHQQKMEGRTSPNFKDSALEPMEPGMSPGELHQLGLKERLGGHVQKAIELISQAIRLNPHDSEFHKDLGNCYRDHQKVDQAIECYGMAIALDDTFAEAYYDLGSICLQALRLDDALTALRKAIQLKPNYSQAYNNLALALDATGRSEQALACLHKALEYDDRLPAVWNNIGNQHKSRGDHPTAKKHYEQALKIAPEMVAALNNLGQIHQLLGDRPAAVDCFTKAMKVDPNFIDSYINLGNTYQHDKKMRKARSVYRQVLDLQPDHPVAHFNMGVAAGEMGDSQEALSRCRKALAANPDYEKACAYLVHLLRQQCAWNDLESMHRKLDRMTCNAVKSRKKPAETPFQNLVRCADPAMNLAVARAWSQGIDQTDAAKRFTHSSSLKDLDRKLRIGYLSNNFRNHPTAELVSGILRHHDRDRFLIACYNYGVNDGSPQRRRVEKASDTFVDLYRLTDKAAARKIYDDGVDILVDLVGHTKGSRMGICAYSPAPLQMRYLGFAGSTGADFFDYIITDKIVTPPHEARHYTERFIMMPDCYHVNNYKSEYERNGSRPGQGKHANGEAFVFGCFNAGYKIDPHAFACWAEMLKQLPGSVLWLLADNQTTCSNLNQWAAKSGIDPDRLTFFNKASKAAHFERLGAVDLALDTFAVSGAATTADALWSGVPVLSLGGGHFASRMSDSILTAAGLAELVVDTRSAYIGKAVELGKNRVLLQAIKEKVLHAGETAPIFDPRRFTQHLEDAYKQAWTRYLNRQPSDIIVL
jgi:protein O-GlcNAc transferase